MVRVVVHDADVGLGPSQHVEPAVRAFELVQGLDDGFRPDAQHVAARKGRQRVEDVVLSRNGKLDPAENLPAVVHIELRHSFPAEADVAGVVVAAGVEPEGHRVRQAFDDTFYKGIAVVGDHDPIRRDQSGELVKGTGDVLNVLEIIQVVGVDVEDDLNARPQLQEAVPVFAGLRDKVVLVPDVDVAADFIQSAADQDRRHLVVMLQDQRDHGCRRGLAMGPGDGDAVLVLLHQSPQGLRPGDRRDSQLFCPRDLRIVVPYRDGIDDQIGVFDILGTVAQKNLRALVHQVLRDIAFAHVRTGDFITFGHQNFCNG